MTPETVSKNLAHANTWLPIPAKQVIYALSTDHYPWSEVWQDLALRRDFTGVLEAREGDRRAQALWLSGELVGAYGQRDKTLQEFSQRMPRALLKLYEADPALIQLSWQARNQSAQVLPQAWPEAGQYIAHGGFTGVLLGGKQREAVSYWQSGAPVGGKPPGAGMPVAIIGKLMPVTPAALAEFWNQVLGYAVRAEPALPRAWESSAKALVDQHPCLDPFIHEVWLEGGRIQVAEEGDPTELAPALKDVFLTAAQKVRFPVATLRDTPLSAQPLWASSGLAHQAGELQ